MVDLPLTKLAETTSTITLGWTPIPCLGYVLYADGVRKSNSWDPLKSSWKTNKATEIRVVALGTEAAGVWPAAPAPPPPAYSSPITITQGGTYNGAWESTGPGPAVLVQTAQPVTISGYVRKLVEGSMVESHVVGAQVTLDRLTFDGGPPRAVLAESFKSFVVRNCTINKTRGMYFLNPVAAASIIVTRNKVRDLQPGAYLTQFCQLDKVTTAAADISWNEVINVFGQSEAEDLISIYASSFAHVHDNYLQGSYPSLASGGHSGSGIAIDAVGCHDNLIEDNQIVSTTNAGCFISTGYNNTIRRNRCVSDGKTDAGVVLAGANVGIYVWNSSPDPAWANNQCYGNTVGWVNAAGSRNDWWLPDVTGTPVNTQLAGSITAATEQAEYASWQAKLAANGVAVGA